MLPTSVCCCLDECTCLWKNSLFTLSLTEGTLRQAYNALWEICQPIQFSSVRSRVGEANKATSTCENAKKTQDNI